MAYDPPKADDGPRAYAIPIHDGQICGRKRPHDKPNSDTPISDPNPTKKLKPNKPVIKPPTLNNKPINIKPVIKPPTFDIEPFKNPPLIKPFLKPPTFNQQGTLYTFLFTFISYF